MPTENNYSDNEIIETKNDLTDEKRTCTKKKSLKMFRVCVVQSSEDTIRNKKTNIEEDSV